MIPTGWGPPDTVYGWFITFEKKKTLSIANNPHGKYSYLMLSIVISTINHRFQPC